MSEIAMPARFQERLQASASLRDLRILVEAAVIVVVTWLMLGWLFDRAITQADGSWLVVPYTDSALQAGGDWTAHAYRFGVLGGSEMHAFGGMLPLVQLAAWLGLSTTATVNLVTCFIPLVYGVFAIRLAESIAGVQTTPAQRVIGVWIAGFAPLLGNRLAVGHENLLLGLVPLVVVVSLVWQARTTRASGVMLALGVFAIANGVSGLGAQSLYYSVLFGAALVVASVWGTPRERWLDLAEVAVVAVAGVLIVLPRLVPMIEHALGPDATRALGASVTTPYGAAPASDWLTSVVWTLGDHEPGTAHEHNYPLGPLLLLVAAAWPTKHSRVLVWTMLATLVVAILNASEVPPVSTLVGLVPGAGAFRCPSRATMVVLVFVPGLALACWLARDRTSSRTLPWLGVIAAALLILLGRGIHPVVREALAWLIAIVGSATLVMPRLRDARFAETAPALALPLLAALGVLAFDERFPRHVPSDPVEDGPAQLREAIGTELTSALDRVVLPDAPPPYDMSTAFAARLPSIDGIWYPPPRFLALLSALGGKPLPPTTSVFRLSRSRDFLVLQQLYNVRFAVRGLGTDAPSLEPLPPTPGPAWFPETIETVERPADMLAALSGKNLHVAVSKTAWVLRAEAPPDLPARCTSARVVRTTSDQLGERATIGVSTETPCVLVVSTNFATTLIASARVGEHTRGVHVFPVDIALTGIVVPAGASEVALGPDRTRAAWPYGFVVLAFVLLGGLVARHWRGANERRAPQLTVRA